ncbi:hypothetical protein HRbin02_01957 [Candidatus Calditenuaceae archaeon HR02]|nr:hypothetical protein HRbin02_01957 [Candidatus Calditenuaceae archaeon HR02]
MVITVPVYRYLHECDPIVVKVLPKSRQATDYFRLRLGWFLQKFRIVIYLQNLYYAVNVATQLSLAPTENEFLIQRIEEKVNPLYLIVDGYFTVLYQEE